MLFRSDAGGERVGVADQDRPARARGRLLAGGLPARDGDEVGRGPGQRVDGRARPERGQLRRHLVVACAGAFWFLVEARTPEVRRRLLAWLSLPVVPLVQEAR